MKATLVYKTENQRFYEPSCYINKWHPVYMTICGGHNTERQNQRLFGKGSNFNQAYAYPDRICPTLASKESCLIHFVQPKFLAKSEVCCISSFPQDYNFGGQSPHYVCGMSVPPLMMAQVSNQI